MAVTYCSMETWSPFSNPLPGALAKAVHQAGDVVQIGWQRNVCLVVAQKPVGLPQQTDGGNRPFSSASLNPCDSWAWARRWTGGMPGALSQVYLARKSSWHDLQLPPVAFTAALMLSRLPDLAATANLPISACILRA